MLLMRRKQGETILIGDTIEVHIAHIGRTRVKIAIRAPREVRVVAKEVETVGQQNRAAANTQPGPALQAALASLQQNPSSLALPHR